METADILYTSHLDTGYSVSQVVCRDVNLSLRKGSLTCMIGRNGAGKSTLIRTVCGLLAPLGGHVTLNGRKLSDYTHSQLARTQSVVLTEIISEINYLSVRTVVEMGRYPYCNCFASLSPADHKYVDDALNIMGIKDLEGKNMASLSDGQRQKVMTARALAQDTEVIILDEPLSFLDMPSRIEIMSMLKDIARTQNKAVLLSSHDMELALHYADSLWVIGKDSRVYHADAPYVNAGEIIDDIFGEQGTEVKKFLRI